MSYIYYIFLIFISASKSIAYNEPSWNCRFKYTDTEMYDATGKCNDPLILTPYIKSGKIKEAQKLASVHLLNVSDIESYSGFFTVNDNCSTNMFFWYFPSERKSENDPLVLWLQGGPGKSSLNGLVDEIGPFYIENEKLLKKRKYYWSDKRNLLFIDSPVGVGFSYNNEDKSCYSYNVEEVTQNLYRTLYQFYKLFPNLQKNELFIFGDSGRYIPALAHSIHESKDMHVKMNLKGLGIANGFVDPISMLNYSSLLYNIGLVNENGRLELEKLEANVKELIKQKNQVSAYFKRNILLQTVSDSMANLDLYNYLEPLSPLANINYFNNHSVKCVVHASNVYFSTINPCVHTYLIKDYMESSKLWIEKLLENYRIMFYNGQVNVLVGPALTQDFIYTLKWSGAEKFKKQSQFAVRDKDLIAFGTHYGNLCEFRIRNAGYLVSKDQPKAMYDIMEHFVNNNVSSYL